MNRRHCRDLTTRGDGRGREVCDVRIRAYPHDPRMDEGHRFRK